MSKTGSDLLENNFLQAFETRMALRCVLVSLQQHGEKVNTGASIFGDLPEWKPVKGQDKATRVNAAKQNQLCE